MLSGVPLTSQEAYSLLQKITEGEFNECQISAILTFYMTRPVTVEELSGFREALLDLCVPVKTGETTIDMCGTGGDGKNTFNISTLSSFVVAAAGIKVTKHGNYGVSSVCGSSNVLEYLGFKFSASPDDALKSLKKTGICFLHAPLFHPALKSVAGVRKQLGVRTLFNMLGPLVNPARPALQVTGVYNMELARLYKYLLQQTSEEYFIVHGLDGFDEISLTSEARVLGKSRDLRVIPGFEGVPVINEGDIAGGETVKDSADIFMNVITGKGNDACNKVVAYNSALALFAAGKSNNINEAAGIAEDLLLSGRAYEVFKNVINLN